MNNPEGLPIRNTIIRRRCQCARLETRWVRLQHCEPQCRIVHLVWDFEVAGDWWQQHLGLFTLREADEVINLRPNGPTADDLRRAWGA